MRLALFLTPLLSVVLPAASAPLPADCRQLIVGIAETWDSNVGSIQCFDRERGKWRPASAPQRVLFGKNGLAWGIGVAGQDQPGGRKVEGDNRAPAGLFALGHVFTDEAALPAGADYPFRTVTPADCWIENPALPEYNRHIVVDPANPPAWFEKERMKQNDPAHRWKIEIRHNSDPPRPGMGSAIFFHIWRGPNRHSAGCTTMPQPELLSLIRWLRADAQPHYVLLPAAEYRRLWKDWKLPKPDDIAALAPGGL